MIIAVASLALLLVARPRQEQNKAQSAMDRRPERIDRDRPMPARSKDPKVLLDDSTPGTGFEPLGVTMCFQGGWLLQAGVLNLFPV